MADDQTLAFNIGSLPALPGGTLLDTDMIEIERPSGDAGVPNENYRLTAAQLRAALAGDSAKTGDFMHSLRDPGAGWLLAGRIYQQAAYPALFGLAGTIPDGPPGATWSTGINTGRAVRMYARISDTEIIGVGNNIIWRSHDGGRTWSSQTTTWDLSGVWALPSGVWAAGSNVLLFSVDGGAFAAPANRPPITAITKMIESQGRVFATAGAAAAAHYSDNKGATAWQTTGIQAFDIHVAGPSILVAAQPSNNSQRSTSNGLSGSWVAGVSGGVGQGAYPTVTLSDGSVLLCHAQSVKRLSAAGTQLTDVLTGVTGYGLVRAMDRIILLAVSNANIRFTDNDGAGWVETSQSGVNPSDAVMVGAAELILAPNNGNNAKASPFTYSYDPATQFRAPTLLGARGQVKEYIKA